MSGYRTVAEHLVDELALLDLRIALLLERLGVRLPEHAGALPGLVVTEAEVANLLSDPARRGETPRAQALAAQVQQGQLELARRQTASGGITLPLLTMVERFGLSPVERLAIVACLAVELERKYEKLFGFLHDDLTRRWPSADLVLDLAGLSGEERLQARAAFEPQARLLRTGLLRRLEHPIPTGARPLELDSALAAFLTGQPRLPTGAVPGPAPDRAKAAALLGEATFDQTAAWLERTAAPVVLMHGPAGAGRRTVASALCAALNRPLWVMEPGERPDALRDAALQGAAVAFVGLEAWLSGEHPSLTALRQLVATAEAVAVPLFLLSTAPWHAAGELGADHLLLLPVPAPGEAARADLWRTVLTGAPLAEDVDPDQLAARFRFPPGRVHAACRVARDRAALRAPGSPITMADLLHGCRAQSAGGLGPYATRVEAKPGWDRLVLPPDDLAQLHEFCDRVRHRRKVFEEWGFAGGRHRGLGFSALFHGASGTGKTLAAEIIAAELGIEAYKVDLSAIVSKYVGETEKNLARLFAEAEESQALLFFDEADSLFNKRVQVKDAHDR
ncbi:MAG TPA: AAA family ATPase, partial [Symbiobacteriaceae bacterium]|nr:AAA family ATPase [Symbiobacteriaceae bacterium]